MILNQVLNNIQDEYQSMSIHYYPILNTTVLQIVTPLQLHVNFSSPRVTEEGYPRIAPNTTMKIKIPIKPNLVSSTIVGYPPRPIELTTERSNTNLNDESYRSLPHPTSPYKADARNSFGVASPTSGSPTVKRTKQGRSQSIVYQI